jgi:hypothetical protein
MDRPFLHPLMDLATRRAVAENAVQTLLRDLDARVPDTGPFPEHRWAIPFPPPYGPQLRLEMRVQPERGASEGCVLTMFVGGTRQELCWGSKDQVREELGSAETPARVVRFLDRALEDVLELIDGMRSFDFPLVAIDRDGVPYGVLDHRDVGVERWGPGDLHCVWWRLLLRSGGSWRDAGIVHEQAESARFYLHDRILTALAAFEGRSTGEFSFRLWKASADEVGEPIRYHAPFRVWWGDPPEGGAEVSESEIDGSDPAVARLREICRAVIAAAPNQEQALLDAMPAIPDRPRDEEAEGAASDSRPRARRSSRARAIFRIVWRWLRR